MNNNKENQASYNKATKFVEPEPIKPLTSEQLKELGITPNN